MNQSVPLVNAPNATMTLPLAIDNTTVILKIFVRFNAAADYWVMTIWDNQGNLMLDSVPLLTGNWPASNILAQQVYMGIGSAYVLNAGQVPQDWPDDDIGFGPNAPFMLVWSDTPAL